MIPFYLKIRIMNQKSRKVRLFIPLILIWIVLFAILIGLAPLILIGALILWKKRYGKLLILVYPMLFSLICALSGLHIQIETRGKEIALLFK